MTNEQRTYFTELAADIAEYGPTGDLMADMQAAHARRQAFAVEMANGRTDRAKMARKILAAKVYGRAVAAGAMDTALEHCAEIAGDTFRRSLYV